MIENFLPTNRYTLELSKYLQKRVKLTFLSTWNAGDIDKELSCECKKILYNGGKNKIQGLFIYLKSIRIIKQEMQKQYDVIHVQTFKIPELEMHIYRKYKKDDQILVHTVHNVLPHEAKQAKRKLYGEFYQCCDLLIAHNERTKQQLMFDFNISEEKIAIIPHGIFGGMIPNHKHVEDITTFLIFGMVRKYKGIDILLKAIAILDPSIRERCRFIIAGKQWKNLDSTDYISMAQSLKIEKYVKFDLRRIEDEELPNLYSKVDCCIFPYREIYGSGALMMAYTYMKPVIASNIPTFVEETQNGRTGILFKTECPESLAEAIENFTNLDEKQRFEYSKNIETLVKRKYDWRILADKTVEAYQTIIEGK